MKLVFFGTGGFALPTLKKLLDSGHEVLAAVSQPDKKKGRGWNVLPMPVKALMEKAAPGTDILQPESTKDTNFMNSLRKMQPDIFVIVDYGQLLVKELLEVPKKYCVNLHPSLLPKYRGAAPVNWTIINGEEETGATVIRMTERMDAGEIIAQEKVKIHEGESAEGLLARLSQSGAGLMLKTLDLIEQGKEQFIEQDENEASYAPKLEKKMGRIDWKLSPNEIIRKVAGLKPWPGAFTILDGKTLKVLEAAAIDAGDTAIAPGTVCDEKKFIVRAGDGAVLIKKLQLGGKKTMPAEDFLRGYQVKKGTLLG